MAANPKSKQIYVRWQEGNEKGGLHITLGTLEYLGIKPEDLQVGEISYSLGPVAVSRKLYPGGPSLNYNIPEQTVTRVMGGQCSTAKAGHPMILEGSSGGRDTIRVTGSRRAFAKWLKSKANLGVIGETVVLKNYNKTTYAVLQPMLPA